MKKRWLPRLGERPFEHRRGALQASKRPVTWLKGMTSARRQKNIAAAKKNAGDRKRLLCAEQPRNSRIGALK